MPKNVFAYFRIEDNKKSYRLTREFKFIAPFSPITIVSSIYNLIKF